MSLSHFAAQFFSSGHFGTGSAASPSASTSTSPSVAAATSAPQGPGARKRFRKRVRYGLTFKPREATFTLARKMTLAARDVQVTVAPRGRELVVAGLPNLRLSPMHLVAAGAGIAAVAYLLGRRSRPTKRGRSR